MSQSTVPNPQTNPLRGRRDPIAIFTFGLVTFGLFLVTLLWDELGSPWGAGVSTGLAVALFVAHLVFSRGRLASMDPLIWVPVFMLLFYFGTPVAVDLMGFSSYGDAFGWVPKIEISYAINLMGLAALFFGIHLAGLVDARAPIPRLIEGTQPMVVPALLVGMLGFTMLVIGVAIAGPSLIFGFYVDLKMAEAFGTADVSWFNTGLIVTPAACTALLAAREPGNRWIPQLVFVAMGIVCLLLLLTGDRGGLAIQVLGVGWIFTQRIARVPKTVAVVGFMTALVVMPIIKEYRNYRNLQETNRLGPTQLVASTFYETGSSGLVFAFTVDAVPQVRSYDYGGSIAMPVAMIVPWIARTSPVVAETLVSYNPNYWISEYIDPASYEVKGPNHGFTMTGVWYTNFGIPGVFVLGTLMGVLAGKMRNLARGTPMQATLSGLFVVFLALLIRNSLSIPLRYAFWPLLLLVAAYYLSPFVFGRPARRPATQDRLDSEQGLAL